MEQFFLVLLTLVFGLRGSECTFYNETVIDRSSDPQKQSCDCYKPGAYEPADCVPGENYCNGMCRPGYYGKYCKLCMPGVTNHGTSDHPDCSSCVMKDKALGYPHSMAEYQNVRGIGQCLDKCRATPGCYFVSYNDRYSGTSSSIGNCKTYGYLVPKRYNIYLQSSPRNCLRNEKRCVEDNVPYDRKIIPNPSMYARSLHGCRKMCLSHDNCDYYIYSDRFCGTMDVFYHNIHSKRGYVAAERYCTNIAEEYEPYQYSCKPGYYGTNTTCNTCWTRSKTVDGVCSCRMENTAYYGLDIDHVITKDLKECHEKCRDLPNCDFINYGKDKKCWRKWYGVSLKNAPAGVTSGPKYCKPGQSEAECYAEGKEWKYFKLPSFDSSDAFTTARKCQEYCQSKAECEVFTFKSFSNKCHLYSLVKGVNEWSGTTMASRNCDLLEGY